MTDPRTAALAEALRSRYGRLSDDWPGEAAAILAALPADWCGHGDWAAIHAKYDALMDESVGLLAEIVRLRRIEEAARAYVALFDTMNYPDTAAMYPTALRAALEEDR